MARILLEDPAAFQITDAARERKCDVASSARIADPLTLGTALLADAALALLLWNVALRLAGMAARLWPGLVRTFV